MKSLAAVVLLGGLCGLPGCTQLIGADGVREQAACVREDMRCDGPVRQRCDDQFTWVDIGACNGKTPVCTREQCLGVQMVAAGGAHTCAVLTDGSARCWGRNSTGQLGDDSADENLPNRLTPTQVADDKKIVSLSLGGRDDDGFSCAVHEDGSVACWGKNIFGELGGATTETLSPKPLLVPGLADITAVAAGFFHACALHSDTTVSCWGTNVYGPATITGTKPSRVEGLTGVLELAAGGKHTCARTATEVLCWGWNDFGQCGQDVANGYIFPPQPVPGLASTKRISAGYFHTCALTSSGQVRCWGSNQCGQLGDGSYCGNDCPNTAKCGSSSVVAPIEDLTAIDIGTGAHHTCIVEEDKNGRIYCWGRNDFGQVSATSGSITGMGFPFVDVPVPTSVLHAVSLAVGPFHGCALLDTGDVRCIGRNDYGQLGGGTTDSGSAVGVRWQDERR
ncbi:MAG: hypothetical protein QM820_29665 [Minicystis sp.]